MIKLSKRMEAIVSMVTHGNSVCDVGCDHAFIDIALVERNISPHALAMDINKGPLRTADRNIARCGLSDKVTTRLSDGLKEYKCGEAGTLLITGMGGKLVCDILFDHFDSCRDGDFKEMILSPQSEIFRVRHLLSEKGLSILDEKMILEDGKYYTVIKASGRTGQGYTLSDEEIQFGPVLIARRDPVLGEYLNNSIRKEEIILCKLVSEPDPSKNTERIEELTKHLKMMKNVLEGYK